METAQDLAKKTALERFDFQIGGLLFAPSYVQAGAIIFLLFLLVLTLARLRRMYVGWSLKGSFGMMFLGFMLAIVLEGFLIIGGRTALTEFLGWKNAPKPLQTAVDSGREKLVEVLGETTEEVPDAYAGDLESKEGVIEAYQSLKSSEASEVKNLICSP